MNADDIYEEYLRAQLKPPMLKPPMLGPTPPRTQSGSTYRHQPRVPPANVLTGSEGTVADTQSQTPGDVQFRQWLDTQAGETGTDVSQQMQRKLRPGDRLGMTEDGRPIIVNRDGGVSATKLSAVPDPRVLGRWMNVPTLVNGRRVSEDEARRIIIENDFVDPETGAAIETFRSVDEAIIRSLEIAKQRDNDPAVVRAMQELNRWGFEEIDVPGAPGKEPAYGSLGLDSDGLRAGLTAGKVERALNVIPGGLTAGFSRFVAQSLSSLNIIDQESADNFEDMLDTFMPGKIRPEERVTAAVAAGSDIAGQFVLPAIGGIKTLIKLGAHPLVATFVTDTLIGAFGVSPNDPTLGNLIPEDSEAFGALRKLIAKDPSDPEWMNRSREAGTALAALGIAEFGIRALLSSIRKWSEVRQGIEAGLVEKNRIAVGGERLAVDPADQLTETAANVATVVADGNIAALREIIERFAADESGMVSRGGGGVPPDFRPLSRVMPGGVPFESGTLGGRAAGQVDESGMAPLKRRGSGQYVGAPKALDSPQKLAALRRSVVNLYKAGKGEGSKFWYERSGRAILEMFGGDIDEAQMFAKFVAVTSPEAPVKGNLEWALRAWNQYKAGGTLQAGKYPNAIRQALESVLAGGPVTGNKRKAFYANLMTEIDPTRVPARQVTVDRWILDAFGFKRGTTPTDAQYEFVANEIRRIADDVGWEPHQVQASIWVANKAKVEGTEIDAAAFDFSTALAESRGQISWEAIPHPTTRHLVGLENMPAQVKAEYHYGAAQAFLDDKGRDILAKELGIATPGSFEAPGAYKGGVQPGEQTMLPIPWTKSKGILDPDTVLLINTYAGLRAALLRQEAIAWHLPIYQTSIDVANGVEFRGFGRALTEVETTSVYQAIIKAGGDASWAPVSNQDGYRILNFTDTPNPEFAAIVRQAHNVGLADVSAETTDVVFRSQGDYLTNDWKEFPNGQAHLSRAGEAGRPDLQKRADRLYAEIAERLDAFDAEFAQRHGLTSRPRIIEKAESQGATP